MIAVVEPPIGGISSLPTTSTSLRLKPQAVADVLRPEIPADFNELIDFIQAEGNFVEFQGVVPPSADFQAATTVSFADCSVPFAQMVRC